MRIYLRSIVWQLQKKRPEGPEAAFHRDICIDIDQDALEGVETWNSGAPFGVLKTHQLDAFDRGRSVYVFRRPEDSLCSLYHFRFGLRQERPDCAIDEFCLRHVADWKGHIEKAIEARAGDRIHFASYETMHDRPGPLLRSVSHFLNLEPAEGIVEQAIGESQFERYTKRRPPEVDPNSQFFRKGIVGSSRDELEATTLENIERATRDLYTRALACEREDIERDPR